MARKRPPRGKNKRLFPRRHSADYINVYQGPNRAALGEYHARVQTTSGARWDMEPRLSNSFMWAIPDQKGSLRKLVFVDDLGVKHTSQTAKADRVDRQHEIWNEELTVPLQPRNTWQGPRHQGISEWHGVKLFEDKERGRSFSMWFSGQRYFFLKFLTTTKVILQSVVYPSRADAMFAWENTHIKPINYITEYAIPDNPNEGVEIQVPDR